MMARNIQVVYITGNHDEVLRKYSGAQFGNLILADKYILKINNRKMWIFHGDVFDNTTKGSARILARLGGKGYDFLILLNRALISLCCGRPVSWEAADGYPYWRTI